MAAACGEENAEAIYRRLTDTCGSLYLGDHNDYKNRALLNTIKKCCHVEFDTYELLNKLPPVTHQDYVEESRLWVANEDDMPGESFWVCAESRRL